MAFHGLDLYSLYASTAEVVHYLDERDPETARIARQRYGCLAPYRSDPQAYGLAAITDPYRSCERDIVAMVVDFQRDRASLAAADGGAFFEAIQNARLAAGAERYYRTMYYGGAASWNLRDQDMFDTLGALLEHHGPGARGVVWAHNSHSGDASQTEMADRGEHNVGQLVRKAFGDGAHLIGFGTDHGTVAAADDWGGEVRVMSVRPSHQRAATSGCVIGRRFPRSCSRSAIRLIPRLRDALAAPRLERAIGVVYRPRTELQSHYFQARLPGQFDEYIWFDETRALRPLGRPQAPLAADHPFATVDA